MFTTLSLLVKNRCRWQLLYLHNLFARFSKDKLCQFHIVCRLSNAKCIVIRTNISVILARILIGLRRIRWINPRPLLRSAAWSNWYKLSFNGIKWFYRAQYCTRVIIRAWILPLFIPLRCWHIRVLTHVPFRRWTEESGKNLLVRVSSVCATEGLASDQLR